MAPQDIHNIKRDLDSDYGDIVRWIEPFLPDIDDIHNFIYSHQQQVTCAYDLESQRKTILDRVSGMLGVHKDACRWSTEEVQRQARDAVDNILASSSLTLDEIYYLLQELNGNPRDGSPSILYEEQMKKLLQLPRIDDGFLLFLATLSSEHGMSFWVGDNARNLLMKRDPKKWGKNGKYSNNMRLAVKSKILPYARHQECQYIIHRPLYYKIAAEGLKESRR